MPECDQLVPLDAGSCRRIARLVGKRLFDQIDVVAPMKGAED
jgi:hypothetical protein